jgi:hypothetical protein
MEQPPGLGPVCVNAEGEVIPFGIATVYVPPERNCEYQWETEARVGHSGDLLVFASASLLCMVVSDIDDLTIQVVCSLLLHADIAVPINVFGKCEHQLPRLSGDDVHLVPYTDDDVFIVHFDTLARQSSLDVGWQGTHGESLKILFTITEAGD